MTKVINLIAGPGAGKSTIAAELFAEFKWAGQKVELVLEYAKELHWDGLFDLQKDQKHLLETQFARQAKLLNHVDFIITDSPLILGIVYGRLSGHGQVFEKMCLNVFNQFDNINYFVERFKGYQEYGRTQSEQDAIKIDEQLKDLMLVNNIPYRAIKGDRRAARHIYEDTIIANKEIK